MSLLMMSKCWPLQMPPTAKSVLISLADVANDNGICWPSVSFIVERTCFSDRAIRNAIQWLEENGFVVANRANGRKTTYKINHENFIKIDEKEPLSFNRTSARDAKTPAPNANAYAGSAALENSNHGMTCRTPMQEMQEPLHEVPTNSKEPLLNRKDKHNNISDLEKKGEQEKKDVVVNPNPMSNRTQTQTRAVEIAVMLRQRGAAVQASNPYLLEWAEQGISDAQLLTALEQAQSQRHEQNNPNPVNAGYLNAILRNATKNPFGRARTKSGYQSVHERREATARMLYGSLQSMTQPREVLDDGRTIEHE